MPLLLGPNERSNRLGSLPLHAGEHMAVGVERDRDRGVAEPFAHDLRVNASSQSMRGMRVAQVMETNPPDTRDPVNGGWP